jgi:WD40 repeat protein
MKRYSNVKNWLLFFKVLVEHEQSITALAISEDGKHVLTGDKDGQAIIWSFKDGKFSII